MSEAATEIFRRAKPHAKTIIGGVGGVGITTILAVIWPYFTEIKESQRRLWEQQSQLRERIVVLETTVKIMEERNKP